MNASLYLILSMAIFMAYNTFIFFRYGQQRSISDSWYRLTTGDKWMFCIATWGYVLPLFMIVFTNDCPDWQRYIFFVATVLLIMVGIFPDFKVKTEKPWHTIGAEGGILMAMLWGLFAGLWFIPIPFFLFTWLMVKNKIRNHTYWIEIVAYFSVVLMLWMEFVYFPSMI